MKKSSKTSFLNLALTAALLAAACGCMGTRALRGGRAVTTHQPTGGVDQTLLQGENPSQATKQDQETIKVRTYTLPAGSSIETFTLNAPDAPRSTRATPTLHHSTTPDTHQSVNPPIHQSAFVLAAPTPVIEREETRARTELGAAQKDTARELGAKLSSLKGIVWVGVGLFIFGIASLVWPPLKAIIGSITTSAAITLGGIALMILPTLVVGNELLILGGVTVAVGAWFLAHRHGHLRGIVAASGTAPASGAAARALARRSE